MVKEPVDRQIDSVLSKANLLKESSRREKIAAAIDSIKAALTTFRLANDRIVTAYAERDRLIGLQLEKGDFCGPLHDQYHLASLTLNSDLDNLFTNSKTLLNRLGLLWDAALPHALKRGLRFASFGKFLNSLEGPRCLGSEREDLRKSLLGLGRQLDEENNAYRDKYIEHVRHPTAPGSLSTTPRGVRKVHVNLAPPSKERIPSTAPGYIVDRFPEGDMFQIHVAPRTDISVRQQVAKGQILGVVSDGGTGHFDNYGSHRHIFMTPGLSALAESDPLMIEAGGVTVIGSSPEAFTLTAQTEDYLAFAIAALKSLCELADPAR